MIENWMPIPGYEGDYEVSDLGRVRSLPRRVMRRNGASCHVAGRVMSTKATNRKGYVVVNLRRPGTAKTHLVHRLVLAAFVGPSPEGMETRHLNGDPCDNRLPNLAYGTPVENATDKTRHGTSLKDQCAQGHPMSGANVVVNAYQRKCRTCSDAYQRAYRAKRKRDLTEADALAVIEQLKVS